MQSRLSSADQWISFVPRKRSMFRKRHSIEELPKKNLIHGELKGMGAMKTALPRIIELDLVKYILQMESMLFGLSMDDVRVLALQLAEYNGLQHPFNRTVGKAGWDWVNGFRKRHPTVVLRTPEATSGAWARGFNRPNVNNFFDLLEARIDEHAYPPTRIYNCDETSVTTVQTKAAKVLGLKGKRQVGCLTSAERGTLVTAEICMNAAGGYVPPMLIFPRVRMKAELMDAAPPGSVSACHKSGWMQTEIFVEWFKHLVKHAKPTADDPILLILDGHSTHTKSLTLIDLARANHVFILCLPPHTTHRLQPLDVSFMKPLKTYLDQAITKWLRHHPGRVVTQFQLAAIFGEAYAKAATMTTSINGFRRTGIYPTDRHVFEECDFDASLVTDMAMDGDVVDSSSPVAQTSGTQAPPPSAESGSQADGSTTRPSTFGELGSSPSFVQPPLSAEPGDSSPAAMAPPLPTLPSQFVDLSPTSQPLLAPSAPPPPPSHSGGSCPPVQGSLALLPPAQAEASTGEQMSVASSSSAHTERAYLLAAELSPIPKQTHITTRRKGARGKTAHITGSPYKAELLMTSNRKAKKCAPIKATKSTARSKKGKSIPPKTNLPRYGRENRCLYCDELFADTPGDDCIRCTVCKRWAHDKCAGVDVGDDYFRCELC